MKKYLYILLSACDYRKVAASLTVFLLIYCVIYFRSSSEMRSTVPMTLFLMLPIIFFCTCLNYRKVAASLTVFLLIYCVIHFRDSEDISDMTKLVKQRIDDLWVKWGPIPIWLTLFLILVCLILHTLGDLNHLTPAVHAVASLPGSGGDGASSALDVALPVEGGRRPSPSDTSFDISKIESRQSNDSWWRRLWKWIRRCFLSNANVRTAKCRSLWYSELWVDLPHYMVYDLFASSDFCYSNFRRLKSLVWFLGLVWWIWNINIYFFRRGRIGLISQSLIKWHWDNIKSRIIVNRKGSYLIFSSLFLLIMGMNMWGLFPYVFGITTQFVLTIRLSSIIWLSVVGSSVEFSPITFFSYMTPQGSPIYLAPILKVIELVRKVIRPLTLALRLGINMTTGHVLIALMRTRLSCFWSVKVLFFLLSFIVMGYLLFEVGICFIQGFVFSLLRAQYLGEHT